MRAHTQSHEVRIVQCEPERSPGGAELPSFGRYRHEHFVPLSLDVDFPRPGQAGLNLAGRAAAHLAVLERREPVPVKRRIHVRGIRIQALADEEARLPVRVPGCADPADIRGE